jgi:SPP1 family predicted phage head-tail adaptor
MAITHYYTTIDLHTKTSVADGRGGSVDTWAKDSDFQGCINQASSKEIEAAAKLGIEADYKLYCPVDTDIDHTKLLYYKSSYYRIISEPKDTVERGHHLKVLLKKMPGDPI